MNHTDITNAKDPDLRSSMGALLRAGMLARKAAKDTETDLVIVKDGRLVFTMQYMRKIKQKDLATISLSVWLDADTGKWMWSVHELMEVINSGSEDKLSIAIEQARMAMERFYE